MTFNIKNKKIYSKNKYFICFKKKKIYSKKLYSKNKKVRPFFFIIQKTPINLQRVVLEVHPGSSVIINLSLNSVVDFKG